MVMFVHDAALYILCLDVRSVSGVRDGNGLCGNMAVIFDTHHTGVSNGLSFLCHVHDMGWSTLRPKSQRSTERTVVRTCDMADVFCEHTSDISGVCVVLVFSGAKHGRFTKHTFVFYSWI